jgi:hypothetical protein
MQSLAARIEGSIEISWQLAPRNRISQHPDDLKRPRIKWRERRCHSIETRTSTRSASRRNRWPHVGELISRPRKGCEKCAKGISGSVRSISMETSAAPLRAISFSTSASIRASAGRLAAFPPRCTRNEKETRDHGQSHHSHVGVSATHRFRSGEDLENTIERYVYLYNHPLPQSVLGGKTPFSEVKRWYEMKLELFWKQPLHRRSTCQIMKVKDR